jgi:putative membrane protein
MNRWWGRWVLLGAMVMGGSTLAQEQKPGDPQRMERARRPSPQQRQQMELGGMILPDGEQAFLSKLQELNQTEISLGELTQAKATSPAVRQYGEHMVRDHQAANQQLTDYTKQRGMQLGRMEPTNDVQRRLQAATEANKAKLSVLQGQLYDQQYLAAMVADHDQNIQLVTLGRQRYPQLASLLDGLLPKLREHRDQAYQLLGQVQAQAQAQQQPPAQQRQARPPPGERR